MSPSQQQQSQQQSYANGGTVTFQPLVHRTGTLRARLHSYTKRTLGAGGSINEAVRFSRL
jgi:hypothetical protein